MSKKRVEMRTINAKQTHRNKDEPDDRAEWLKISLTASISMRDEVFGRDRQVNRGEHERVPAELMKWVWTAGKKLPGLVRRRQAEGKVYASVPTPGMEMDKNAGGVTRTG
jgi:hypothetical protein